ASSVETRPMPPRSAEAYLRAIFRMKGVRSDCATVKMSTATKKPPTFRVTHSESTSPASSNATAATTRLAAKVSSIRTMVTLPRVCDARLRPRRDELLQHIRIVLHFGDVLREVEQTRQMLRHADLLTGRLEHDLRKL